MTENENVNVNDSLLPENDWIFVPETTKGNQEENVPSCAAPSYAIPCAAHKLYAGYGNSSVQKLLCTDLDFFVAPG